jgi:hypothetical protein
MGRTQYLAILGDLVGSREVPDRAQVQSRLRGTLRRVRREAGLHRVRVAGPEITAGDEFQVLLKVTETQLPGRAAVSFVTQVTEDLRPVRVAFGLGLGTLSTTLEGPIRELDGPCFHHARQALTFARRKGRWAAVSGMPSGVHEAANSILRLTGDIRVAWTDRQAEVIRVRRTWPLQKDVARELGVSESVVSEVLQAARHDAVQEAEEALVLLLNRTASPESFPRVMTEAATDE